MPLPLRQFPRQSIRCKRGSPAPPPPPSMSMARALSIVGTYALYFCIFVMVVELNVATSFVVFVLIHLCV